jgi:hypothetical protein
MAILALPALIAGPAQAQPGPGHHHTVEVRRGFPAHYHHAFVGPEHFYHGFRVWRPYGPRYYGFGFFYDDAAAFAFLGFTAWALADYAALDEAQLRAHEDAIVEASSAPLNDPIVWNDGGASGSVTPIRDGHTNDGRTCREFQQEVTVAGGTQQAYGTACRQPDGSWQIVPTGQ